MSALLPPQAKLACSRLASRYHFPSATSLIAINQTELFAEKCSVTRQFVQLLHGNTLITDLNRNISKALSATSQGASNLLMRFNNIDLCSKSPG
ncbi:MAG: hypothetical protein GY789_27615 [Hyphomicrobiales bacterium]|nr:hypothetical protein [Hyphomicrobiales bacterium]MCP4999296.1 hypothetical protein [Hyphomicrobiales bacterium]